MTTETKQVVVNDLDGGTFSTVALGTVDEVRLEYGSDHPVQTLITLALQTGEAEDTYEIDGEEYTTKVIAKS